MLKKLYISAITAIAAIAANAQGSPASDPMPRMSVRSTADSTTLVMGDRTMVNVEVVKNSHNGVLLGVPEPGKDYYGMEVADITADSADLGNGRMQLNYSIVLQAFDPAEILTLPGFAYASEGDTAVSDILTFKVYPVEIPEYLGNVEVVDSLVVNPEEEPMSVPAKFFDWTRDWMLYVLLGLLLLAAGAAALMLYRKNGPRIFFARRPEPPYDVAMRRLNEMKASGAVQRSQPKQFFSEVTDIFRTYLEGRFGIQAMEMTSNQIIDSIRAHREIHLTASTLEQLLSISDFVKFAAMDPTPDERMLTYKAIRDFVESTKPVEEPRKGRHGKRKEKKI